MIEMFIEMMDLNIPTTDTLFIRIDFTCIYENPFYHYTNSKRFETVFFVRLTS